MKNNLIKILGITVFTAILSLNITSTMDFNLGGEEVQARSMIPCHSQGVAVIGGEYTRCSTCAIQEGKLGTGTESECDNSGVGEN